MSPSSISTDKTIWHIVRLVVYLVVIYKYVDLRHGSFFIFSVSYYLLAFQDLISAGPERRKSTRLSVTKAKICSLTKTSDVKTTCSVICTRLSSNQIIHTKYVRVSYESYRVKHLNYLDINGTRAAPTELVGYTTSIEKEVSVVLVESWSRLTIELEKTWRFATAKTASLGISVDEIR